YFTDENTGWAVGELGTVLGTRDGGKTWKVQRRGGQRAAILFVHARSQGVPLDTIALVGAEEGYLAVALRGTAPDPASAAPECATEAQRLAAAVRQAGGAAGEVLWQFPLPQHLAHTENETLLKAWGRRHADRAAEQMLRQLVLALRMWRPDVLVTDPPDANATGWPVEALLTEAVQEAYKQAADPDAFPEHIQKLGLQPWQASKLYACCPPGMKPQEILVVPGGPFNIPVPVIKNETSISFDKGKGAKALTENASVVLDLTEGRPRLRASARDFIAPAAKLLDDDEAVLPRQRSYRLLHSKIE